MSSKLGTILSLIFITFFVTLSADLISLQYLYSDLDAKSTSIAYLIAKNKGADKSFAKMIEDKYSVEFTCLSYCNGAPGDIIDFKIERTYRPLFISKEEITISIKRQAIISYYE